MGVGNLDEDYDFFDTVFKFFPSYFRECDKGWFITALC